MAKKGKNVASGFYGTYDCFPKPTENQGSNTNGGSITKSRNDASDVKEKGSYDPLVGAGSSMDTVADSAFPAVPKMGQGSMIDGDALKRGKPSFGDGGGASYKTGLK